VQVGELTRSFQAMERPDFTNWLVELEGLDAEGVHRETLKRIAECGIHLTPQTLTPAEQKRGLGAPLTRDLQKGEAAVKLGGKVKIGKTRQYHRDGGTFT
jgi:hypothetical protein